jgi:hypothetical protein
VVSKLITNVSYSGPRTKGHSAARLARYLTNRKQGREPGQERDRYETLKLASGDRAQFVQAAKERAKKGRRSSYVHVVISPERGREYKDRDLKALIRPWTRDGQGREAEHMAVIHRDTENPHIHLAVARDKYSKQELQANKERTYQLQRERERVIDRRREREQNRQEERRERREHGRQIVREGPEMEHRQELEHGGRER